VSDDCGERINDDDWADVEIDNAGRVRVEARNAELDRRCVCVLDGNGLWITRGRSGKELGGSRPP